VNGVGTVAKLQNSAEVIGAADRSDVQVAKRSDQSLNKWDANAPMSSDDLIAILLGVGA
jgi:hypothetical protein